MGKLPKDRPRRLLYHNGTQAFGQHIGVLEQRSFAQVVGDILMGKRCDLKTDHGAFWRRFAGEQSPEDLETAMQLIHKLFITALEPIPAELDTYMQ